MKKGNLMIMLLLVLAYLFLLLFQRETGMQALTAAGGYLKEMILVIPGITLLMGLFEVWIPKESTQKYLGEGSGLKGFFLAFLFGTAPTGPLYIAFPIARQLLAKGARVANVVVFLGAWAALKIPQILMEAKFLGMSFTLTRFSLTLLAVLAIGYLMERILKYRKVTF